MLLVFDIGNTNVVVGAFEGDKLAFEFRFRSETGRTQDEYAVMLLTLLERKMSRDARFTQCVISSVVPPLTPEIQTLVRELFNIEPLIVGPGIKTGLSIKIPDPAQVGADRVVNAVAVKALYGCPAVVVDFGTATSFDYVAADGNYYGGIIAPGATGALDSLVRNTAKLPRIELSWPQKIVGNSTVTAMQSGAVVGYACLIDGLIEKIVQEVGPLAHVVATGGLGRLFAEHCPRIQIYDPNLTLQGMRIIAGMNL